MVTRSHGVAKLVLELNILRSGGSEGLSLLRGVGLELKAGRGQSIERAEVGDGLLFVINYKGIDDSFLGQQEVLNLSFTEVNMHFVSAKMGVKECVDLGDVILSHESEARHAVLHIKLVHFDHRTHAHTLGQVAEAHIDKLLRV